MEKLRTVRSEKELEELINSSRKLVVVYLMAPWCLPCIKISNKIGQLDSFRGDIDLVRINIDDYDRYNGCKILPIFLIFKNKKKIRSFYGSNIEKVKLILGEYTSSDFFLFFKFDFDVFFKFIICIFSNFVFVILFTFVLF
ncbi:hypothetical protein MHBO_000895 [Bonamia ostreae]|uniref:Thioredoxin domain-containing protein n=1 Tax=Bonamia ostreae TaxID=126728 RepID=A0ABV2AHD7_9EUKA